MYLYGIDLKLYKDTGSLRLYIPPVSYENPMDSLLLDCKGYILNAKRAVSKAESRGWYVSSVGHCAGIGWSGRRMLKTRGRRKRVTVN